MGVVLEAGPKSLGDQQFTRYVLRPGLGQQPRQREQDGAAGQRHRPALAPQYIAAGVDDECLGRQQCFHLAQRHVPRFALPDPAAGRRAQRGERMVHFRQQGRDARPAGGLCSAGQRRVGRRRLHLAQRDAARRVELAGGKFESGSHLSRFLP
ncbi:hypothetical protein G6F57_020530 [Rhizopus arrhizus]|nr:hypothetical protein G6F57_020530 [Rhizopus arrhizus]